MKQATLEELKALAIRLHKAQKPWHFHILTPGCALNNGDDCVFVVEDIAAGEVYGYHSAQPEKGLGQELLPLLHGKKVLDNHQSAGTHEPNAIVQKMIARARMLNKQNKPWHHHVLFPQCAFNKHPGQWTLILEDVEGHERFESPSTEEPIADLQFIEPLFYARKT